MPESITITEQQTPALSPENEQMLQSLQSEGEQAEEGGEQLLAGKYKSVEDLEKAYQEAQRKLSQRGQVEETEEEAVEADDSEEERPQAGDAKEIYGDFIGSRLEEHEIDFSDMNARWQQTGQLSPEDYGQLQEAGFNQEMVDAYLSGLQYKQTQDTALSVKEVASIKQSLGGEAEYNKMIEWAAANLSADEVEGFNQIINTQPMAAVKMAITGLHARYSAVEGREPKLIGGRAPKGSTDKFESTAQLVAAMSDPKYSTDPAYQRKVQEKLSRSSIF